MTILTSSTWSPSTAIISRVQPRWSRLSAHPLGRRSPSRSASSASNSSFSCNGATSPWSKCAPRPKCGREAPVVVAAVVVVVVMVAVHIRAGKEGNRNKRNEAPKETQWRARGAANVRTNRMWWLRAQWPPLHARMDTLTTKCPPSTSCFFLFLFAFTYTLLASSTSSSRMSSRARASRSAVVVNRFSNSARMNALRFSLSAA